MTHDTQESYLARVERVLIHIGENLDQDLKVDDLAEIACFSPYHFHRVYRGLVGETVVQTVRRLRLHRAAGDLLRTSTQVDAIAKRAGYSTVEAFSRAFKSAYRSAPAAYRKNGREIPFLTLQQRKDQGMFDIEIREIPTRKLAAIAHHGEYMEIGNTFEKVMIWATHNNLLTKETVSLGVYYDDPASVPVDQLRSEAGIVVENEVTDGERGVRTIELQGGRKAVLLHKGPYAELEASYNWLFGTWLPQSGEELADQPCVESYLNDPRQVEPSELLTEIQISLK